MKSCKQMNIGRGWLIPSKYKLKVKTQVIYRTLKQLTIKNHISKIGLWLRVNIAVLSLGLLLASCHLLKMSYSGTGPADNPQKSLQKDCLSCFLICSFAFSYLNLVIPPAPSTLMVTSILAGLNGLLWAILVISPWMS